MVLVQPAVRFRWLVLAGFLAIVAASPPLAAAAPAPITGTLSKPGYTVIAFADDGRARSVRARRGRFKLRPPAESVTLHLRARNGKYAGPIVVGRVGRRVVVGVRAGARLGRIRIRDGYARLARRLPARWRDRTRTARARRGVPLGARNYGRVRVRSSRASRAGRRGDPDLDGVPNALDIDDDGDLRLDNFERPGGARRAQADEPPPPIFLESQMNLRLNETVNANAAALTLGDIDAALSSHGRLKLKILPGSSAELDCAGANQRPPRPQGLIYCSLGGTGRTFEPTRKFPECCDDDEDGFGALTEPRGVFAGDFFLLHGATTAQIGTGDVLIERVTRDGVERQAPATLQFVFATVPALVSYSDTAGNAATVPYPVAAGGPGTPGNGLPVAPGPDGRIGLTLTFWRPQRVPIAGDDCLLESPPCQWVDIGGLTYTAGLGCLPELPDPESCALKHCPPAAFASSDRELARSTLPDAQGGLADSAPNRAARSANAFAYTLDISECLRDPRGFGVETKPLSWNPGQEREFFFMGTNVMGDNLIDQAQQVIYFCRPTAELPTCDQR